MTIVGYDDRIEFDLNGNGIYGEASADERGAWIVMNSWGADWQNGGAVYVPYAYAGPTFTNGRFSGDWWTPEVYTVRKNYRPLRTIKIKMDYSHRSELYMMAGVAKNLNATEPEYTQAFDHFKYAGDGNYGNTDPAPAIPMQGRWVDGKLHNEPMEFGYDLTDLSDNLDPNEPMKYFYIIETKNSAIGYGHIYNASILDYEQDAKGLEFPFAVGKDGVTVENQGNRTIISVIVPGRGLKAPQNVVIDKGQLVWSAPVTTAYTLTGYKVYKDNEVIATLDAKATSYTLPEGAEGAYALQAIYGKKSLAKSALPCPVQTPQSPAYDSPTQDLPFPVCSLTNTTRLPLNIGFDPCHSPIGTKAQVLVGANLCSMPMPTEHLPQVGDSTTASMPGTPWLLTSGNTWL